MYCRRVGTCRGRWLAVGAQGIADPRCPFCGHEMAARLEEITR